MPGGYRNVFVALAGLALSATGKPNGPINRGDSSGATTENQALPPVVAAAQSAPEAKQSDPGCPKGKENRQSDLCAQWKAADAAADSSDWTEAMFWLGVGGTVLGFLTFLAAAFAAWYAREASRATKGQLFLTRDQHQRSLEAHLQIHSSSFSYTVGEAIQHPFKISWLNRGKGWALNARLIVAVAITDEAGTTLWGKGNIVDRTDPVDLDKDETEEIPTIPVNGDELAACFIGPYDVNERWVHVISSLVYETEFAERITVSMTGKSAVMRFQHGENRVMTGFHPLRGRETREKLQP